MTKCKFIYFETVHSKIEFEMVIDDWIFSLRPKDTLTIGDIRYILKEKHLNLDSGMLEITLQDEES